MKIYMKHFDTALLLFVLFQVLVFNYFGLTKLTNKIAVVLLILRIILLCTKKIKKRIINFIPYVCIFVFLLILNVFIASSSIKNSGDNLLMLLYGFIFAGIFVVIVIDDCDTIYYFFKHIFWPLNIYHVVNLFIMFCQLKNVTFMQAVATFNNTSNVDLVSGLLGYSATPEVALFACFTVAYNFSYSVKCKHPYIVRIYNVILVIVNLVLAMQNDNKTLFILLPYTLFWVWINETRKNVSKRFVMFFSFILAAVLIVQIRLPIIDSIFQELEEINSMISGTLSHTMQVSGSNERIEMIIYAFNSGKTWILGQGLGTYGFYDPDTFGFHHFGQADLGSLLCLGGVWITTFIIAFYYKILFIISSIGSRILNNSKLFIAIYLLILSSAYQVFTTSTETIFMILIVVAIWYGNMNAINKKKYMYEN